MWVIQAAFRHDHASFNQLRVDHIIHGDIDQLAICRFAIDVFDLDTVSQSNVHDLVTDHELTLTVRPLHHRVAVPFDPLPIGTHRGLIIVLDEGGVQSEHPKERLVVYKLGLGPSHFC